jgi:hypothetical protein
LHYCPLNPEIEECDKRGVEAICASMNFKDNKFISRNDTKFVNVDYFGLHIDVELINNNIIVTENCVKKINSLIVEHY